MALAKMVPATIINADASQVYSDLRLLSARPSQADEASVPHRLFGHIDGASSCSAAEWAAQARVAIAETVADGRLPILVGGTGLYIRTILDGIAPVPLIDDDVRNNVRRLDVTDAYAALCREDSLAAARLAPGDSTRVARALEVVRSTGRPLSEWQAQRVGGIRDHIDLVPAIILPPREWLYPRCEARFDAMLANGAVDEVSRLLNRQLDSSLPVMRAIGVREIAAAMREPTMAGLHHAAAKTATRNYAKRQFTWFRNQLPLAWQRAEALNSNEIIGKLAILLQQMVLT